MKARASITARHHRTRTQSLSGRTSSASCASSRAQSASFSASRSLHSTRRSVRTTSTNRRAFSTNNDQNNNLKNDTKNTNNNNNNNAPIKRKQSSIYTAQRTSITKQLWEMRRRDQEKSQPTLNNDNNINNFDNNNQPDAIVTKTPADSFREILYPFATDTNLREDYVSPFGHIRIGRLLEDLDAFAGNISWSHTRGSTPATRPITIVTAGLDRLHLSTNAISPDHNLKINGKVTWVGTSSMEVRICAFVEDSNSNASPSSSSSSSSSSSTTLDSSSSPPPSNQSWKKILTAYFTMVATDAVTRKPIHIHRLEAKTQDDKEGFKQGELNKVERLREATESPMKKPPTTEEHNTLHDLFKARKLNPAGFISIHKTSQQRLILCQSQERNIHGRIFGGYLMRQGFELAFSTAFLHAKQQPFFSCLDDLSFKYPVDIGSILDLKAEVIFTHEKSLLVHVTAEVVSPLKGERKQTNEFYFTFNCLNATEPITPIFPQTYEQGMIYLEGRRKYLHGLSCA